MMEDLKQIDRLARDATVSATLRNAHLVLSSVSASTYESVAKGVPTKGLSDAQRAAMESYVELIRSALAYNAASEKFSASIEAMKQAASRDMAEVVARAISDTLGVDVSVHQVN